MIIQRTKVVQMSGITKQNHKILFFIPECSLPYQKIVQMSGITKQNHKILFFYSLMQPTLLKGSANERK